MRWHGILCRERCRTYRERRSRFPSSRILHPRNFRCWLYLPWIAHVRAQTHSATASTYQSSEWPSGCQWLDLAELCLSGFKRGTRQSCHSVEPMSRSGAANIAAVQRSDWGCRFRSYIHVAWNGPEQAASAASIGNLKGRKLRNSPQSVLFEFLAWTRDHFPNFCDQAISVDHRDHTPGSVMRFPATCRNAFARQVNNMICIRFEASSRISVITSRRLSSE